MSQAARIGEQLPAAAMTWRLDPDAFDELLRRQDLIALRRALLQSVTDATAIPDLPGSDTLLHRVTSGQLRRSLCSCAGDVPRSPSAPRPEGSPPVRPRPRCGKPFAETQARGARWPRAALRRLIGDVAGSLLLSSWHVARLPRSPHPIFPIPNHRVFG